MDIIIQKFGGTSLATLKNIEWVAQKISKTRKKLPETRLLIVVSAMAGETDRLDQLGTQCVSDISDPIADGMAFDLLLSTGEQVSVALLSLALSRLGVRSVPYLGHQIPILTDAQYTRARIHSICTDNILNEFNKPDFPVVIVAGFQGVTASGSVTTLGRGGSDTTAVALGCILQARLCQIYTDVEGVYTSDPKLVTRVSRVPLIHYRTMLELASLGTKVLHLRAMALAAVYRLPLEIRSTFSDAGSVIEYDSDNYIYQHGRINMTQKLEQARVSGLTYLCDQMYYQLELNSASNDSHLQMSSILSELQDQEVQVDLFQCHLDKLSFVTCRADEKNISNKLTEFLNANKIKNFAIQKKLAKVSIVGLGLCVYTDILKKVFNILSREQIGLFGLVTSEIKVSFLIDEINLRTALRSLHQVLELGESISIENLDLDLDLDSEPAGILEEN